MNTTASEERVYVAAANVVRTLRKMAGPASWERDTEIVSDLEIVEKVFAFLQGEVPEGTHVTHVPHLTPDEAWAVVWFVQECHRQLPDHIERCGVCGRIFDDHYEGEFLEDTPPHQFCGNCTLQGKGEDDGTDA